MSINFGVQSVNKKTLVAFSIAFFLQILTWFVLYPIAGYNNLTLNIALLKTFLLGIFFLFIYRFEWKKIGLGFRPFKQAVLGFVLANIVILFMLSLVQLFGGTQPIFRSNYRLDAFLSNWVLTAFGEELFFAGVLFALVATKFTTKKRWIAVLVVAGLFALWHLPGYLAIGIKMDSLSFSIIFDLLLRVISWLIFGFIYLFSGNLWLVIFAHASTDYAILPAVVNQPVIGLIFMGLLLFYAWKIGRSHEKHQQLHLTTSNQFIE
jgi:membrane protease YdiL (CAAX protease family)